MAAAVVGASRSLAKCWLRPAARAVSGVLTLPGSTESDLPSLSFLFPQAARLSGKPPASGLSRRSPRAGAGHCGHGALRVLPLPEQRARPRPAARGASPVPRPHGDLGGGTGSGARDQAESRGRGLSPGWGLCLQFFILERGPAPSGAAWRGPVAASGWEPAGAAAVEGCAAKVCSLQRAG